MNLLLRATAPIMLLIFASFSSAGMEAAKLLPHEPILNIKVSAPILNERDLESFSTQPVSYETWSLFLICHQKWVLAENRDDLDALHDRFLIFGEAIGSKHLAVWFRNVPSRQYDSTSTIGSPGSTVLLPLPSETDQIEKTPSKMNPPIQLPGAENSALSLPDVGRNTAYCVKYKLPLSEGPYVVVTEIHPDRLNVDDPQSKYSVIKLNGAGTTEISDLLTELAEKILQSSLQEFEPNESEFWVTLVGTFVATRDTMKDVLGRFNVTIHTPIFSAETK